MCRVPPPKDQEGFIQRQIVPGLVALGIFGAWQFYDSLKIPAVKSEIEKFPQRDLDAKNKAIIKDAPLLKP
jgi:hypothetical protein